MLLEINNLITSYKIGAKFYHAVDGISLQIKKGKNLGLIGESGCGKTTVIKSILKILPKNGMIQSGSIKFLGEDLVKMDEEHMQKIRGRKISLIPQSAMNALDPVYRVGYQVEEIIKKHSTIRNHTIIKKKVQELFELVGLERKRIKDYPHQLSGGMKQRVLIAMALALEPSLIIADEPTTALDVIMQDRILEELIKINTKLGNSIFYVTHDISVIAETCDKVAVMYSGKIMECGDVADVFKKPLHPYMMGLKRAFPSLKSSESLISIPGTPPPITSIQKGCRFRLRCPFSIDLCNKEVPDEIEVRTGHFVSCHRYDEARELREFANDDEVWQKVKGRFK